MFNFFKKKEVPEKLVFKSDIAAFEYVCEFMVNGYENEMPCIGIVIQQKEDGDYVIKIANNKDTSVPAEIDADTAAEKRFIYCISAKPMDSRIYKNGDLVFLIIPNEISGLGMGPLSGLFQKINPVMDFEKGWEKAK